MSSVLNLICNEYGKSYKRSYYLNQHKLKQHPKSLHTSTPAISHGFSPEVDLCQNSLQTTEDEIEEYLQVGLPVIWVVSVTKFNAFMSTVNKFYPFTSEKAYNLAK